MRIRPKGGKQGLLLTSATGLPVGIYRSGEGMENELMATYNGDSRHYHFLDIDKGQGVMGTIYVPKDKPVHQTRTIRLRKLGPRPKDKQALTTGEVSRMLGGVISQRTVIRYFDKGILTGWKHPVSGCRVVDLKSVQALKRKWSVTSPTQKEG
jgi:hypothetical protein